MAMQMVMPTPTPPPPLLTLLPIAEHGSSLYVGDLHPYTTDTELYTLFTTIGPVHSARICRDRSSRKALCYAYINFFHPIHAAAALCRLNHTELRGKPIRIMWCQRDPLERRTGLANLFVKNIDSLVTDTKLEEVFGEFGRILSCKIAKDDRGKSKGFGFVQFDSEESANNALSSLNGTTLDGKTLSVARFLNKSERKEPEFTNVYVKNLDSDFTQNLLIEKFSEYGKVTSAIIMADADGKSRGFGFVNFESHDSAKKAIEALNGAMIGSKEWFVGKAMKKAEREGLLQSAHKKDKTNASNLFVKNLATSVDEKALEETFGEFGHVVFAKVMRYKSGISKGFGFVCFSNPEEAKKARDTLNGNLYHGKNLGVCIALSKEECAQKFKGRLTSQINTINNQYLQSYYGMQPFIRTPVYDPYWQPNSYERMPVLPNFKPLMHQEGFYPSYNKDQKPFMISDACFPKGSLSKEAHQNLNGVKRPRVLWDVKPSELKGLGKAFSKLQVKNDVGANEGGWNGSQGGLGLQANLSY